MDSIVKNITLKGDKIIWIIVFALSLLSIMVVYSAAGWSDLISHIVKLMIGLLAMYIVHLIPFKYFSKLGQIGYFTSLLLLLMVLVIGVSINGASRWINIAGLQFQPSDVAKLTVILYMARQISINRDKLNSMQEIGWYVFTPLLVVCVLILPNNFSTAALVFVNGLVLMFVAKVKIGFIARIVTISLLFVFGIYFISKYTALGHEIMPRSATWVSRIDSFFIDNQGDEVTKDFQQIQALVAVQKGGLTGLGPGKSTQRSILPFSSSDFIYAIIIEEYGLLGGGIVLLFYLILMFRAIRISIKTESIFGSLLVVGLMFSLVFQALINMLVSLGFMPVTGQTLPFISMGGTSMVFSCIAIGIILSVSRDSTDRNYAKA